MPDGRPERSLVTGKAIGIIEAQELLPLIEAGNAMRKAAEVSMHVIRPLGGGVIVGVISGELGAVRVAIEAANSGSDAESLRSGVLPHPSAEVWMLLEQTADLEQLEE